jgi:hypothetical protein
MTFHPKSNATFLILLLSVAERRKKGGNLGMFFGQILFLLRRNCYEKISKRKKKTVWKCDLDRFLCIDTFLKDFFFLPGPFIPK